jgi:hypothetical protein
MPTSARDYRLLEIARSERATLAESAAHDVRGDGRPCARTVDMRALVALIASSGAVVIYLYGVQADGTMGCHI